MITIDGRDLLNLEEAVKRNKSDIADILSSKKTIAEFGIHIVGEVKTEEELPEPAEYVTVGEYGDAYLVGTETPYNYYIFTRPNNEHPNAFWLNIGVFPQVGPQGPQGPQGETGATGSGSKWYVSTANPTTTSGFAEYDQWLNSVTGYVFSLLSNGNVLEWVAQGSIIGPQGVQGIQGVQGVQGVQGPQGPKGDTGDVGGFINVAGIVPNTSQLPTPETLKDLTKAYLVGSSTPYNLYIQVGSTSAEAIWTDMGNLNVGTYVTVDGNYVNVLEMSNYQPKIKSVILSVTSTATSGTITQEELNILQADTNNTLTINNEIYRLSGNGSTDGVLDYSCSDTVNGIVITKVVSINLNNLSWVLNISGSGGVNIKTTTDITSLDFENIILLKVEFNYTLSVTNELYTLRDGSLSLTDMVESIQSGVLFNVFNYYYENDETWVVKFSCGLFEYRITKNSLAYALRATPQLYGLYTSRIEFVGSGKSNTLDVSSVTYYYIDLSE